MSVSLCVRTHVTRPQVGQSNTDVLVQDVGGCAVEMLLPDVTTVIQGVDGSVHLMEDRAASHVVRARVYATHTLTHQV